MTTHQKLQLLRHLEAALRGYEWIRHRNALGEGAHDQGMRDIARQNRLEAEANIADCQDILTRVRAMETVG